MVFTGNAIAKLAGDVVSHLNSAKSRAAPA